ncbi:MULTISPECIES: PEP-CTERM sorting domain-containing protein [Methylotenera]|uniref:PEP-CTERM sorting domain-containing protein n=1 Tax=Methylotenera TaxID=359407 RepID=UPI0003808116|nr:MULTISPECIES: PEP-CTERM sorting domain-containing protein [Methylotenera]
MKVQFKALAAVVVLAAALPAHAAIDTAASGNGSLVLSVFDRVANISANFDLGKNYSDFTIAGNSFANSGAAAAGTNFSWDLSTGDYATAWNQFFSTATLANTVFAIGAGDNLGAGAGNRGFITTYSVVGNNITSTQAQGLAGFFDVYTGESASSAALFQNHTVVANGSSVANAGAAFAGQFYGGGKNNAVGATAVGAIGTDLGVLQYLSAASSFATSPVTIFGNGAKFNLASNGALVYSTIAAVPEADTWAMMLLGLGFMGFIARRKSV